MKNKKKGSKSRKEHINLPVWATEWRLIPKTRENGKIDRVKVFCFLYYLLVIIFKHRCGYLFVMLDLENE